MPPLMRPLLSPAHITAAQPIMIWVLAVIVILSLALIGGGIWLTVAGSTGATEMSVLGNHVKTQSVGVTGVFAGLVLGVIGVKKTLEVLQSLAKLP